MSTRSQLVLLAVLMVLSLRPIQAGTVAEPVPRPASSADDPLAELVRKVRANPQTFSYTRISLEVAGEVYLEMDAEKYEQELDQWAVKLRKQTGEAATAAEIVARANALLFGEAGLKCAQDIRPEKEDPDLYFPHAAWHKRKGVCLGLSTVYLSVAEKAGLPLYGVHAPQHIFVRFDNGKEQLNIETTDAGRVFDVDEYCRRMRFPEEEKARLKETYFKNIGKLEVLGDLLNAAAWCSAIGTAKKQLSRPRAVLAAELCVEIAPGDYNNWDTLAQAYSYAGRPQEALAALRKAIEMRPPAVGEYDQKYWADRLKRFEREADKKE